MLQIDNKSFASDALEDAMRLAQVKALNSFTFSDCLQFLNYAWRDIYDRMAMIDDGYYGTNVQITKKMTKLPPFVKNTVQIYEAQSPFDCNRLLYRSSGTTDITAPRTYKISGTDLYVPQAETGRKIWLYYVPMCPQIFFTNHNRDPILHEEYEVKRNNVYNLYTLHVYAGGQELDITNKDTVIQNVSRIVLKHRTVADYEEDITDRILLTSDDPAMEGTWDLCFISCDYPYVFVTYKHSITGEHKSGFFNSEWNWNEYNPFDFIGRSSDVEYLHCKWNDKTGMGVVVKDYNDTYTDSGEEKPRIKELGWTPDTLVDYPIPEMYRYLVARLADKFSALNESNIMGVQKELLEARYAFEAFLDRDKSSFKRMVNVNPATIDDWL